MIVYAVNVHTGGGKVLLDELIQKRVFGEVSYAFIDQRYQPPIGTAPQVFYSKNKILERLLAEFKLHKLIKTFGRGAAENVIFFGNLPPFFKPKIYSILYLQNCFLTRQMPLPKDSKKEQLRNFVESLLLKCFAGRVDEIWVQTNWMKECTQKYLPKSKILVKPFLPSLPALSQLTTLKTPKVYKFIFVGSLSLNKRLNFFLSSLENLDLALKLNLNLNLNLKNKIQVAVVLDGAPYLQTEVVQEKFKNINIDFFNQLSREELALKYGQSECFVATSLYESLCLPIYEAHNYECKVLVPRAGYTRDLPFAATYYDTASIEDLSRQLLQFI